jgi:hypothetical protein
MRVMKILLNRLKRDDQQGTLNGTVASDLTNTTVATTDTNTTRSLADGSTTTGSKSDAASQRG